MAWNKTDSLLNKRLNQHGLAGLVQAGLICHEAERLYPDLFKAVSVRQTPAHVTLHLSLPKANHLKIKLVEGKLIQDLNRFTADRKLPQITRVRLTFSNESDTV